MNKRLTLTLTEPERHLITTYQTEHNVEKPQEVVSIALALLAEEEEVAICNRVAEREQHPTDQQNAAAADQQEGGNTDETESRNEAYRTLPGRYGSAE